MEETTDKLRNGMVIRLAAILMTIAWVGVMIWASDAQMRESDQASLLTGAVELARGKAGVSGNESYNYDKQYLSYWVVASVLRVSGGAGADANVEGVVRASNLAATLVFAGGLLALVAVPRRWSWPAVGLLGCILLSPVVAFSGMLLSSNLISGGIVLFLMATLCGRGESGWGGSKRWLGCVLLLAFAATAARQDAVLLMPLLVAMTVPWRSCRELLRHPVPWMLGGGCLAATMVGKLIDPSPTPLPEPFFSAPTFVVYLAGGLGGCLVAVLAFSWRSCCRRTWEGWALGGAVLLPLVFYCCMLYTPRHLFTAALALTATVLMPRGGEVWAMVASTRFGRVVVWITVLAVGAPWLAGVRLAGMREGALAGGSRTLYPTTDGFWPLGAYGTFFVQLARAAEVPVDHNQEVWGAWMALEARDFPPGKARILSSGLTSYGVFALRWHNREVTTRAKEAAYVLFDDRTIAKRQLGVNRSDWKADDKVGELLKTGRVEVVGRGFGRSVLLWRDDGAEDAPIDEGVSLRVALSRVFGGNDFRQAPWSGADWKAATWTGHRIVLAARSAEDLSRFSRDAGETLSVAEYRSDYDPRTWHVAGLSGDELARIVGKGITERGEVWIACGMLPEYMDVANYGK